MLLVCWTCRQDVRMGPLPAFDKELEDESAWYLVDTIEPKIAEARTILTTSPKRDIYKVWWSFCSPPVPVRIVNCAGA